MCLGSYYRILSFDGGGILGIFQAHFCKKLWQEHLLLSVQMATGTSTGAIIACAIALNPKLVRDLPHLYEDLGKNIFGKPRWLTDQLLFRRTKYSVKPLRKSLVSIFEGKTLGDCDNTIRLVVPAFCTETQELKVFDSAVTKENNIPLVDVILASTAAPTFFPPHVYGTHRYIDGGIACNNPSYLAYSLARNNHNTSKKIRILSVNNTRSVISRTHSSYSKMRLIDWIYGRNSLIQTMIRTNSNQAHQLLEYEYRKFSSNYVRIHPEIADDIDMDDYKEALNALVPISDISYNSHKREIDFWARN